jgi:uncharacterized protein
MTTAVFADTSFYVALLSSRDHAHEKATRVGTQMQCEVWLTDFILLELGNTLSSAGQRELFSKLVPHLRTHPHVHVVPASRDLFDEGIAIFSHRGDKEWSLTDCTSFVVMRKEGLQNALTTDHHFEQAGFQALLR